jgi:hypothetical protein
MARSMIARRADQIPQHMRFLWGTVFRNRLSWFHVLDFLPLKRTHYASVLTMIKPAGNNYYKTQIEHNSLFKYHDIAYTSDLLTVCNLPTIKISPMVPSQEQITSLAHSKLSKLGL